MFVGHSPGVGYPGLRLIPDKLLSSWRVSSGHQPDSLSPGNIYNIYNLLFTIKIFTILCTILCAINKDTLRLHMYNSMYNHILQKFSLAELNSKSQHLFVFSSFSVNTKVEFVKHLLRPLMKYTLSRGFNNFGDKQLFEVEQTAVIEKGP